MQNLDKFKGWKVDREEGYRTKSSYLDVCEAACKDENVFNTFKSNSNYITIAEHCPMPLASSYYEELKENSIFMNKISFLKEKEKHGNPILMHHCSLSTSTIRYAKVANDLKKIFKSLKDFNIIEVGGAYGGQATVLYEMEGFKSYSDIDLKWPSRLAEKYCKKNNINNFFSYEVENFENEIATNYDLAISNYAFSECTEETQDMYIEKVFSRSKRGYLTINGSVERRERIVEKMNNFENFHKWGTDQGRHQHPIYVWGSEF